nr:hypothetical protein [Mammaliicoccus sp. Marseille-Q6498]
MYFESNMLISPKLDYHVKDQLQVLSKQVKAPSKQELFSLIETLEYDQPFLNSVTIGTSNDESMIKVAYELKNLLEHKWYDLKGYDIYVNIIIWKDSVGSSKKYVKQFLSNKPDSWVVLGSQVGFSNMVKRLYREHDWDKKRTYCLSTLLSQAMINIVGKKYFEDINGITYQGENWKVENGRIVIQC